jgi:hypothetical protein
MTATFIDTSAVFDREALSRLVNAVWVLPRCLMNRLSGTSDDGAFEGELQAAFGTEHPYVRQILDAPDRPVEALIDLSFALDDLPIDEKRRLEIDKSIIILGDCVSSCERIFTSPVPLVYTRHTARFLSLWMLLLPFPLYDLFVEPGSIMSTKILLESLVLLPAVTALSVFLFGIQELSVQLEEPFSILPLQRFCDQIYSATRRMEERDVSKKTIGTTK